MSEKTCPDFISCDDEREHWQSKRKKVSCDQVSSIMGVLERMRKMSPLDYGPKTQEALQLSALLHIMDILGYEFEDNNAAGNALSLFDEFNDLRGI